MTKIQDVSLEELIDIKHGFAFKSDFFQSEPSDYILLTPGNFNVNQTLYFGRNTKYYLGDIPSGYVLDNGDLLVVMTDLTKEMNILGNAVILQSKKKVLHNQRIGKITIKDHQAIAKDYLMYVFNSDTVRKNIKATASGTTVRHTSPKKILELVIPLPPLLEQCRIAEVLGVWDESIDLLERLIGRVRSRKQGLMQQLLTGKKRFKEFEGSDNRQKTLYGSLPLDWKYLPIADIAQEYSTKNKEANDLTVLSCSKYKGLVNSLEYFGKQVFSEDTSTYKIVKYGMFAYATNHIDEGSIGYQNLCDKALISPMYTVFKTDSNRVHDLFLYSVLKTEYYRQIFSINTSASVERRGSLRWKDFSKIKIPLPSLPEQEKIAAVLSAADEEISTLEKQLAAYKQQKLGLMQQLLTGRIRI
jgi:type I restriction enzyme, S subunit